MQHEKHHRGMMEGCAEAIWMAACLAVTHAAVSAFRALIAARPPLRTSLSDLVHADAASSYLGGTASAVAVSAALALGLTVPDAAAALLEFQLVFWLLCLEAYLTAAAAVRYARVRLRAVDLTGDDGRARDALRACVGGASALVALALLAPRGRRYVTYYLLTGRPVPPLGELPRFVALVAPPTAASGAANLALLWLARRERRALLEGAPELGGGEDADRRLALAHLLVAAAVALGLSSGAVVQEVAGEAGRRYNRLAVATVLGAVVPAAAAAVHPGLRGLARRRAAARWSSFEDSWFGRALLRSRRIEPRVDSNRGSAM